MGSVNFGAIRRVLSNGNHYYFPHIRRTPSVPSLTHLRVTVTGVTRPEVRQKISCVTVYHRSDTTSKINCHFISHACHFFHVARHSVKNEIKKRHLRPWKRSRGLSSRDFLDRNDVIFDASFAAEESASYALPNANSFPGNYTHLSRISSPDD